MLKLIPPRYDIQKRVSRPPKMCITTLILLKIPIYILFRPWYIIT
nr:MAG TPA: hypothetical protein [Caudoviricetes sp.]